MIEKLALPPAAANKACLPSVMGDKLAGFPAYCTCN